MKVRFLDYLMAGHFGKSEMIETRYAAPTLIGLNRVFEQVTPMTTKIPCYACGTELASPIHLEYLLHLLKPPKNPAFYT